MIDWTINIGSIILIGIAALSGFGAIGGALFVFGAIKQKFDEQTGKISGIQDTLKELNKVVIAIAVQDTRITNVERDIRLLKMGQGFITHRQDGGIQGEY